VSALTNGRNGMTLWMHSWICPQIFHGDTFKFNDFIEKRYENARHMFNYIDQFVFLTLFTYMKSFLPHIRERIPSPDRLKVFIDWVKLFKKELFKNTKKWSELLSPQEYNKIENFPAGYKPFKNWNMYIKDMMIIRAYSQFDASWSFRHQYNKFILIQDEIKRKLDWTDLGLYAGMDQENETWALLEVQRNNSADITGSFASGRSAI
jgi:hypothetical protein